MLLSIGEWALATERCVPHWSFSFHELCPHIEPRTYTRPAARPAARARSTLRQVCGPHAATSAHHGSACMSMLRHHHSAPLCRRAALLPQTLPCSRCWLPCCRNNCGAATAMLFFADAACCGQRCASIGQQPMVSVEEGCRRRCGVCRRRQRRCGICRRTSARLEPTTLFGFVEAAWRQQVTCQPVEE